MLSVAPLLSGLEAMLEDEATEQLAYDVAFSIIRDDDATPEDTCITTKEDSCDLGENLGAGYHCDTVVPAMVVKEESTPVVPSTPLATCFSGTSHTTQASCSAAQSASWPVDAAPASEQTWRGTGARPKVYTVSSGAFPYASHTASGIQGPPLHLPASGPPNTLDNCATLQHHVVSVPASPPYAHPLHATIPNGSPLPAPLGQYGAIPWPYPYSPPLPMQRPAAWLRAPLPWDPQGTRPSNMPPLRSGGPNRPFVRLGPEPGHQWHGPWPPPWPPQAGPMHGYAPQAWPPLSMGRPVVPAPNMQACVVAPTFVPRAPRPPPAFCFQGPAVPNPGMAAEPAHDPRAAPPYSAEEAANCGGGATSSVAPTASAVSPAPPSQPPIHVTNAPVGQSVRSFVRHTPKAPQGSFLKGSKATAPPRPPPPPPRLAPRLTTRFVPRPSAAPESPETDGPASNGANYAVPEDTKEQQQPVMSEAGNGDLQKPTSVESLGDSSCSGGSSPTGNSPTGQSRSTSDVPCEQKETTQAPDSRPQPPGRFKKKRR